MKMIIRYLGAVAGVMLTVRLVPGIDMTGGWETTLLVALVWSVIALVIRPVLSVLALPVTILTFGLFSLVLNALLFWAMTLIVPEFFVDSFWSAVVGAISISIIAWLVNKAFQ